MSSVLVEVRKIPWNRQRFCSQCGAIGSAGCDHDAPLVTRAEAARRGLLESPEKSNRLIAAETGVSKDTVRKIRGSGGDNSPRAWLVDSLFKNGTPRSAVRYEHSYGHITDANDTKTLKKLVREEPELMERPFTLRVPRDQSRKTHPSYKTGEEGRPEKPRGAVFAHRGALARAVKAGRISAAAAQQLTDVSSS
jgi:hypothetical protein